MGRLTGSGVFKDDVALVSADSGITWLISVGLHSLPVKKKKKSCLSSFFFLLPSSQDWALYTWLCCVAIRTWPECCSTLEPTSTLWSVPFWHTDSALTKFHNITTLAIYRLCILTFSCFPPYGAFSVIRISKVVRVPSCMRWSAIMQTWFTSSLR